MEQPSAPRSNHLLAIIGGSLVITGLLALIISSWSAFTPVGRILTAVLPLVAVYVLAGFGLQREEAKRTGRYALITASTALPLVLGVIIFQSGLYTEVDATLITILALVSTANAGLIEFLYGDTYHTPLTLISLFTAALGFINWFELGMSGGHILLLLVGGLMLGLGMLQATSKLNHAGSIWQTVGAYLTLYTLVALPLTFGVDITDDELRTSLVPLMYVGAASIAFLIAAMYSRLWQAQKAERYLYDIRSLYEHVAPLMLMLPAIGYSLGSESVGAFLVLLGASTLSLYISAHVRIRTFRTLGIVGAIAAFIRLLIFGIDQLAAIWPIVLVATGVLFLAFAVFGARSTKVWGQSVMTVPETSWQQLGEPFIAPQPQSTTHPTKTHDNSGWAWLILGLILLWFLSTM